MWRADKATLRYSWVIFDKLYNELKFFQVWLAHHYFNFYIFSVLVIDSVKGSLERLLIMRHVEDGPDTFVRQLLEPARLLDTQQVLLKFILVN